MEIAASSQNSKEVNNYVIVKSTNTIKTGSHEVSNVLNVIQDDHSFTIYKDEDVLPDNVLHVSETVVHPSLTAEKLPTCKGVQAQDRGSAKRKSYCCQLHDRHIETQCSVQSVNNSELTFHTFLDCGLHFLNFSSLEFHIGTHVGDVDVCCSCDFNFSIIAYENYQKTSVEVTSLKKNLYKSDISGQTFTVSSNLNYFKRIQEGEHSVRKNDCGIDFTLLGQLSHEGKHTGDIHHVGKHTGDIYHGGKHTGDIHHVGKHTGDIYHVGDVFGVEFSESKILEIDKRICRGEKPYVCDVCGLIFMQNGFERQKRINIEEKLNDCDVCGVGFMQYGNLMRHRETHEKDKSYTCDVCVISFAHKSYLEKHLRTFHGKKPYKCDFCGAGFVNKYNLMAHSRSHTREKPYKCDVCGIAVKSKSSLARHKDKHTREKPYKCDVCGACFTQNGSLVIHKRLHTGEKLYKCGVCGVSFKQNRVLLIHTRTHTGEKTSVMFVMFVFHRDLI